MNEESTNQPQIIADERRFKHQELTETIIGVFYEVYQVKRFAFDNSRKKISVHLRKSAAKSASE